jgi:hypothetical protein
MPSQSCRPSFDHPNSIWWAEHITVHCSVPPSTHQFLHHPGTSYGTNVYVDRSVCNMNRMFLRLDMPLCFQVNKYVIPVNTTKQFPLLHNSELMFLTSDLLRQRQPDCCSVHDADRPTSSEACGRHYDWRFSLVRYLQFNLDDGYWMH